MAMKNAVMLVGNLGIAAALLAGGGAGPATNTIAAPLTDVTAGRAQATKSLRFAPAVPSIFTTFESEQVRPLAMSPDGGRLYAVNTPDNSLEIFSASVAGLRHEFTLPVGLEPVAVAARTNGEVWVVNHLSDSVSIVATASSPPRVIRTLLVGDEPRDIVFAGTAAARAFITTAHRGQNSPYGPALMPDNPGEIATPGIGRADVWVFKADSPGTSMGGDPVAVLSFFTDTPRALAVSGDGSTVYVAGFHTGNRTTAIIEGAVCDRSLGPGSCTIGGTSVPGPLPPPEKNIDNVTSPENGLIVKFNPASGKWEDEPGRDWSAQVPFNLPDRDVFAIDADATPPAETAAWSGVGTILFNMVTNPQSGKIYVSNTQARNEVRFEGERVLTNNTTVNGHLHEARITVLDGSAVLPRHINKHIDYGQVPSPAGVSENSLAIPSGLAVSPDGGTLYVAAFGSSKIGVFDTAALENDSFVPDKADHIAVSGGGASGLALDAARDRLYVLTRFDNSVSVIDTNTATEILHVNMHNPEPVGVVEGRPFLYDALYTSSNGEAACASCHVFGDFDGLAWDLGNPEGSVLTNPNLPGPTGGTSPFHPMKGPMTTQSLRGLANHGPMHWRGDRTAGHSGGDPMDEAGAFREFNVAFAGLMGRSGPLTPAEMDAFASFMLEVTYPPNPNRPLDNSLTPMQQNGSDFFFNVISTAGILTCNACHLVDPPNGFSAAPA